MARTRSVPAWDLAGPQVKLAQRLIPRSPNGAGRGQAVGRKEDQPGESAFRVVLLVVAVGLASFVGTRLGSAKDDGGSAQSQRLAVEMSRCAEALDRIVERLEASQSVKAQLPLGDSNPRPQALSGPAPLAAEIAELQQGVGRFLSAVETLTQTVKSAAPFGSGLVIPETPREPQAIEALKQMNSDERQQHYMFWTYQRVLDTFGKPDFARPDTEGTGIKWRYGPDRGEHFIFWFKDGMVAQVID